MTKPPDTHTIILPPSPAFPLGATVTTCTLYTSDAADDMQCVDSGSLRNKKKKKRNNKPKPHDTKHTCKLQVRV